MHMVVSPFVNFVITVYSMAHSDDFKWGKTREVVEPETEGLLEGDEKRPTMV
jgi:chitin synthase